jgi:hypothetical protein
MSDLGNIKETAVFHAMAMGLGLMTPEDVVAWCDEVIATHPDPPLAILRASVVKGKKHNEVENELALLEGEFDEAAVYRRLLEKMVEVVSADRDQSWEMIAHLHLERFFSDPVSEEAIENFYYERYTVEEAYFSSEENRRRAREHLIDGFLDFLQKAARGETKEYVRQEYGWEYYPSEPNTMRTKLPGLIFEAFIVGVLTSIAVLLMRSQEQAGSGIGWGEVILVVIIITLYFGIGKWRRKR